MVELLRWIFISAVIGDCLLALILAIVLTELILRAVTRRKRPAESVPERLAAPKPKRRNRKRRKRNKPPSRKPRKR